MTSGGELIAFAGVVQLGVMSPGPDFAFVLRRSLLAGRRVGMITAVGIASGVFVWASAAATGVAALFAASQLAYTLVKIAGAAYLVFLGIRALQSAFVRRHTFTRSESSDASDGSVATWVIYMQGVLCNLLNPKGAVFFVALMPQFSPKHPTLPDTLLLSLIAVLIALVWFATVANLVAALRRFFASPAATRVIEAVMGAVLILLGGRLAVSSA